MHLQHDAHAAASAEVLRCMAKKQQKQQQCNAGTMYMSTQATQP
jgi:hypothetical protein